MNALQSYTYFEVTFTTAGLSASDLRLSVSRYPGSPALRHGPLVELTPRSSGSSMLRAAPAQVIERPLIHRPRPPLARSTVWTRIILTMSAAPVYTMAAGAAPSGHTANAESSERGRGRGRGHGPGRGRGGRGRGRGRGHGPSSTAGNASSAQRGGTPGPSNRLPGGRAPKPPLTHCTLLNYLLAVL